MRVAVTIAAQNVARFVIVASRQQIPDSRHPIATGFIAAQPHAAYAFARNAFPRLADNSPAILELASILR
jgi:hypothetical protein